MRRLGLSLGLLLLPLLSGCVQKTLDPPDLDDVALVPVEKAASIKGGEVAVRPAAPGETLFYRYKLTQRAMEPADWNPVLAKRLTEELGRRGVSTEGGGELTVQLVKFRAGAFAASVGRRVKLVAEVRSADGFQGRFTGTGNDLTSLKGAIRDAVTDLMRVILIDPGFREAVLRGRRSKH